MAQLRTFSYGSHELQKIHVYKAQDSIQGRSHVWVIYIHGGAWRDNTVLADSFSKTHEILSTHPLIQTHAVAFASIDYRLSPHPNAPQDPDKTPKSQLRDAVHPDHLHDVQAALAFLQEKYAFKDRYILVGHSCGATLAFQVVMDKVQGANLASVSFPKPIAVAGVCGIYDLRLLRNDFKDIKIYDDFIRSAFGSDEELWDRVSPGKVTDQEGVAFGWQGGQLAVLASSTSDFLINEAQTNAMSKIIGQWKDLAEEREVIELHGLKEGHDDVWRKGEELANVVVTTIRRLAKRKNLL